MLVLKHHNTTINLNNVKQKSNLGINSVESMDYKAIYKKNSIPAAVSIVKARVDSTAAAVSHRRRGRAKWRRIRLGSAMLNWEWGNVVTKKNRVECVEIFRELGFVVNWAAFGVRNREWGECGRLVGMNCSKFRNFHFENVWFRWCSKYTPIM